MGGLGMRSRGAWSVRVLDGATFAPLSVLCLAHVYVCVRAGVGSV
jgi:hypothetical protein